MEEQARFETSNAYRLFVNELPEQLAQFEEVFKESSVASPEDVFRSASLFHKIKGGSGFLGLPQISEIAARMEFLLNSPVFSLEEHRAEVWEGIQQLRSEVDKLPKPADV